MGITPARAGKTAFSAHPCTVHGDHPRSCGKDKKKRNDGLTISGSPPLVRERLPGGDGLPDDFGITPARAGKTMNSTWMTMKLQDHPRSCGKDRLKV